MVQLALTANVDGLSGQLLVWLKSPGMPPVGAIPVMVKAARPVFCSVEDCTALLVFAGTLLNVRPGGVKVTAGPLPCAPVPVSVTVCGLPAAVSLTLTEAERAPRAAGLKVTAMVQLKPATRVMGQLLVCGKSPTFAPDMETLIEPRLVSPELVTLMFCTALGTPTV